MKYKTKIITTFLLILISIILFVFNEKIDIFYSSIFYFQASSFKLPIIQLFISIFILILKMLVVLLVIDFEIKLIKMIECRITVNNYRMLLIKNFVIVISIITLLNVYVVYNMGINHQWVLLISDIGCLSIVGLIHLYFPKVNYMILTLIVGITSIIVNYSLMILVYSI